MVITNEVKYEEQTKAEKLLAKFKDKEKSINTVSRRIDKNTIICCKGTEQLDYYKSQIDNNKQNICR